jgi:flavin reductase (DIM6/NTAB) family NADH-FMN oxidoreductase RutF
MTLMDSKITTPETGDGPHQEPGVIREDFRAAMRKVASTVTLITTADPLGNPHGMAATAVISASMDPPSMLVAVNRSASLAPVLGQVEHFCINLLSSDQASIVEAFSRSELREQRFSSAKWLRGYANLPVHADALTAISCRKEMYFEYGTHGIYVGRVVSVTNRQEGVPLVWFAGGHAKLQTTER